jgi:cell division septal protein FtsQ
MEYQLFLIRKRWLKGRRLCVCFFQLFIQVTIAFTAVVHLVFLLAQFFFDIRTIDFKLNKNNRFERKSAEKKKNNRYCEETNHGREIITHVLHKQFIIQEKLL